jgi:TDG/mug DNA glycosylase family protein
VLFLAGFTSRLFNPADDRLLLTEGRGLTAVVARPTASAGEASSANSQPRPTLSTGRSERISPGWSRFWVRRLTARLSADRPSSGAAKRDVRRYRRMGTS